MRIIAGKLRGSTLYIPKDKNTRPLKDSVRENIFNLLTHSNKILFQFERSNILDLYAGSGSFGLECISRQANSVYFIEKEKSALKILKKNIEKLSIKKKTKILSNNVLTSIEKTNISEFKFDLIFCDPPYKDKNIGNLIELIFKKSLLNKRGIIVIQLNKMTEEKFPNYFKIFDERTYGLSKIIFGKILC